MTAHDFAGKVVIVTGAARGIGRATAVAFAARGARVLAWDRDTPQAPWPAGAIVTSVQVDVTDAPAVDAAVADAVAAGGRLDVLVNNAGIVRDAQLVKWRDGAVASTMIDETFDAVWSVNVRGVFHCTRAAVPHMIRAGGGVILNATSVVAHHGNFGQTNYVASKTAVIGMTHTWARELGRHGIRVNAVAPGFIQTDMTADMPPTILERMVRQTPLGRMGEPADVAAVYVWLASEDARFVHGAVIPVDGGLVIGT